MTATYEAPFGWLQLTAHDDYISSIMFVSEPMATNERNAVIDTCILQFDEYFKGHRRAFNFPMQQNGTAFQQRVWEALTTIPFGKTISYAQLSKQLGDPKAIRAVGLANGRNNLAIVVPCHRVIGTDNSLTGYAGGLHAKRWLLEHEARFTHGVRTLF